MSETVEKDPAAILDYGWDWSDWLDSDTISSSSWTVPAGITKQSDTNSSTKTTIWLVGGTLGETYSCVNTIVTAGGRQDDRTLIVKMVNK